MITESSSEDERRPQQTVSSGRRPDVRQVDSREELQCHCATYSAQLSLPVSNRPDSGLPEACPNRPQHLADTKREEELLQTLKYVSRRPVDPAHSSSPRPTVIDDTLREVQRGPSQLSIAMPPLPSPSNILRIHILESQLGFAPHSERGVDIIEESNGIRYELQRYEWSVRLQVEALETRGNWCIGFVQSCTASHSESEYGSAGSVWWECNELSHGRRAFLNDADEKSPPFDGSALGRQLVNIRGPRGNVIEANEDLLRDEFQTIAERQNAENAQRGWPFTLESRDNPDGLVAWDFPTRFVDQVADSPVLTLTAVRRSLQFIVWLALYDCEQQTWFGLKTVKWKYVLEMTVDTSRPLGNRVHVERDEPRCEALQKEDADRLVRIPPDAVMPPYANACQSLIWRPRHAPNCTQKSRDRQSGEVNTCECNLQPVLIVKPIAHLATWDSWQHEMLHEPQRGPLDSTKRVGECPFCGPR